MKATMLVLTFAALLVPIGVSLHDAGCLPSRAEPSTISVFMATPDGRHFYVEERSCAFNTSPPPPGCGTVFGGGTWTYEETNGIDAPEGSLQRGDSQCFFPPPGGPSCILLDQDPVIDESCGHGPDHLIF